jgi:uncharacterized membrane protein YdfJ with MMPL/SSD domain
MHPLREDLHLIKQVLAAIMPNGEEITDSHGSGQIPNRVAILGTGIRQSLAGGVSGQGSRALTDYRRMIKSSISDRALGIKSMSEDDKNMKKLQNAFRKIQVVLGEKMQRAITTSKVDLQLAKLQLKNGLAGLGEIKYVFRKLPRSHQTAMKTN